MSYDPQKIYNKLVSAGEDWADKKAAYQFLDDSTKSILAQIKAQMAGSSDAERTTLALASEDYKKHLKFLSDARKAFLRAQVKYDSIKALSDHRRTEQSTRRAEMQHL